jgi:hypothetical protein
MQNTECRAERIETDERREPEGGTERINDEMVGKGDWSRACIGWFCRYGMAHARTMAEMNLRCSQLLRCVL